MRSFLIQKRHQRGGPNLRPRTVSTRRSNTTLLWSQKATANLWISRSAMTRSEFGFPHSRTSYRQRKLDSLSSSLNSRSEEHTSELQSLMRISYAVFCLKKKQKHHLRISPLPSRHFQLIPQEHPSQLQSPLPISSAFLLSNTNNRT